jgi:signal transduction histidine kinase
MLWAALVGGISASSLSYWLSKRIIEPLLEMEEITGAFAAGDLDRRLPEYEILNSRAWPTALTTWPLIFKAWSSDGAIWSAILSHELRTPLTILKGYLEGMADGTIAPDPVVYERLTRETQRLQRLVNDLQELSQLESGYLPIDPQPTDLRELLSYVVRRFADQQLPDAPVQIQLDVPKKMPLAQADAERIEQVMVNLLSNALRHTQKGCQGAGLARG